MPQARTQILPTYRFSRGVTLVELLITMVIIGILAAIAVPAMSRFINDIRVSNVTNEFVNALNTARAEAIKRGRLVTVCRSTDAGTAATPSCANDSDWSAGWLVFVESSSAATNTVTTANILARHGIFTTNVSADATGASSALPITFNSTGEPVGAFNDFTLAFKYNHGCGRKVFILRSGRVTVTADGTPCG